MGVGIGVAVGVAVGVGVGVGVGGAADLLTRTSLFCSPEVPKRKSPVTGSMATPSGPTIPNKKSCWLAGTGSPCESKGAMTILLLLYFAIKALLAGNPGAPGGTKAMPSASPTFVRRVVLLMKNVPFPSGARATSYQSPLGKETSFIVPAVEKFRGTKASDPTDEVTPNGPRSMTLFTVALPGLLCSSWLPGYRVTNRTSPRPKATPPSLYAPICDVGPGYNLAVPEKPTIC